MRCILYLQNGTVFIPKFICVPLVFTLDRGKRLKAPNFCLLTGLHNLVAFDMLFNLEISKFIYADVAYSSVLFMGCNTTLYPPPRLWIGVWNLQL